MNSETLLLLDQTVLHRRKDELCPARELELNTQKHIHITECIVIKMSCPSILANKSESKYEDLFSDDPDKINNIAEQIETALRKREQLSRKYNSN